MTSSTSIPGGGNERRGRGPGRNVAAAGLSASSKAGRGNAVFTNCGKADQAPRAQAHACRLPCQPPDGVLHREGAGQPNRSPCAGVAAGAGQGAVRQRARCRRGEPGSPRDRDDRRKDGTITITDNANGIATETNEAVLHYNIPGPHPAAYFSPT